VIDASASATALDGSFDLEFARLNKERADAQQMLREFLDGFRRSRAAANPEFKASVTDKSLIVARGAYEIAARAAGTDIEIVVSGQQANEQERLSAAYRRKFADVAGATEHLGQLMARLLLDRI